MTYIILIWLLATSRFTRAAPLDKSHTATLRRAVAEDMLRSEDWLVASSRINANDELFGHLIMANSLALLHGEIAAGRRRILLVCLSALLLGAAITYFIAVLVSRPIQILRDATNRITGGEEKPATVARATPTVDWHDLSLPEELRAGFAAAAKTQSITELNKHIDALPDLGPAGESLATHLRALARKYDLRAIRETLAALGID